MDTIQQFVARCDRYADGAGVSRVTVSKKLFGQTRKLDDLAKGLVDVGVKRLGEAEEQLTSMERELGRQGATADPPPDQVEA